MFGDIIYAYIQPYGFIDGEGDAPESYTEIWVDQCPAESEFIDQLITTCQSIKCKEL